MKILLHRILTIATILTLVGCSNKNIENEQSEEYRNEVLDSDEDEVEYVNIDTAAYNAGMERLHQTSERKKREISTNNNKCDNSQKITDDDYDETWGSTFSGETELRHIISYCAALKVDMPKRLNQSATLSEFNYGNNTITIKIQVPDIIYDNINHNLAAYYFLHIFPSTDDPETNEFIENTEKAIVTKKTDIKMIIVNKEDSNKEKSFEFNSDEFSKIISRIK
jgi:hypothetical protein